MIRRMRVLRIAMGKILYVARILRIDRATRG